MVVSSARKNVMFKFKLILICKQTLNSSKNIQRKFNSCLAVLKC